jgi:hypothetical protein
MIVAIIADVALRDRLPDPIPTGLGLLALGAGMAALVLWIWADIARALGALARSSRPPRTEVHLSLHP